MPLPNIGNGRTIEFCTVCRQADDHPRHVVLNEDGTVLRRHLDCCADGFCPDASCQKIITHAGDKRGADLLAHIQEHHLEIRELVSNGD